MSKDIIENLRKRVQNETKDFTLGAQIKFEGGGSNNYVKKKRIFEYNLLCPCCNGNNMHQRNIGIYNREEDEETGTHVEVNRTQITIDNNLTGNPSPRRQGLSILFWCEYCDGEYILNIYQHKGLTLMGWENE